MDKYFVVYLFLTGSVHMKSGGMKKQELSMDSALDYSKNNIYIRHFTESATVKLSLTLNKILV